MKKLIILISAFLLLHSCTPSTENGISKNKAKATFSTQKAEILAENTATVASKKEDAEVWLENLFQCRNGNQFCFYLETEEKATTKRFYQFMIDSEQIYGATNLSDEEMPIAEKNY